MQSSPKNEDVLVKTAKVLIVDDDYYTRKVIRTLLAVVGIDNVHDAIDGASGLDAIGTLRPDVVILDWEMPGIDGAEFTRRVRSPATPHWRPDHHADRPRRALACGRGRASRCP
jgi:CheY-like chemotaxis protein